MHSDNMFGFGRKAKIKQSAERFFEAIITISDKTYSQVIEMLVDTHLLMERDDGYPLIWSDDGMLTIIEILYEKSPLRTSGCMKNN